MGVTVGLPDVTNFKNHEGLGLSGNVLEQVVCVGNVELMESLEVEVRDDIRDLIKVWNREGCTVILIGINGNVSSGQYYNGGSIPFFSTLDLPMSIYKKITLLVPTTSYLEVVIIHTMIP